MGNFANNSITDVGKMLLADVQAGAVFVPTRIVIGSGSMSGGATTQGMTDVITPVKSLVINKKKRTPDGKCVFGGVYTNQEVTEPFYFRELALYAKAVYHNEDGSVKSEGAETLYSYGNAGATADYMPAYSSSTVVEKQMDLVVWVGNDAQVDLTISSGVYVTHEIFNVHASRHALDGDDPITPADIGAAPAGYGLGEALSADRSVADCNTALECGWYVIRNAVNTPPGVSYGILEVSARDGENLKVQTVKSALANGTLVICHRTYSGGWSPWEWANPPLELGVEYRTTERRNGKVVYKKYDTDGLLKYRLDGETVWNTYAQESGALDKNGDTMTGNLSLSKETAPTMLFAEQSTGSGAQVQLWKNQVFIANYATQQDSQNYRSFYLANHKAQDSVTQALRLTDVRNGVANYYTVLHTGNLSAFGLGTVPASVE